jgi:hypothetical protein
MGRLVQQRPRRCCEVLLQQRQVRHLPWMCETSEGAHPTSAGLLTRSLYQWNRDLLSL